KKDSGFTIIEVMIVLAIAGLIILIVLLAVPALQRNSRNTAMKNDASAIAGGLGEFASNNDGAVATSVAGTGTVTIKNSATPPVTQTTKVQGGTVVSTVTVAPTTADTGAAVPGKIAVYLGKTCSTATGGTFKDSSRAASIYYASETSGGNVLKCLDN
ncbi:MAG: hypothetical protein JWM81_798, partial [Candidatus Saccharibacteria bacterium]|nr:hypothetical protein [Candidatus Saccharibacteria bacterium]